MAAATCKSALLNARDDDEDADLMRSADDVSESDASSSGSDSSLSSSSSGTSGSSGSTGSSGSDGSERSAASPQSLGATRPPTGAFYPPPKYAMPVGVKTPTTIPLQLHPILQRVRDIEARIAALQTAQQVLADPRLSALKDKLREVECAAKVELVAAASVARDVSLDEARQAMAIETAQRHRATFHALLSHNLKAATPFLSGTDIAMLAQVQADLERHQ